MSSTGATSPSTDHHEDEVMEDKASPSTMSIGTAQPLSPEEKERTPEDIQLAEARQEPKAGYITIWVCCCKLGPRQ